MTIEKINHPYLTAIKRTDLSVPVRYLLQHSLLKGRILDFGCGKQEKLLEDYLSLGHTPQEIVSMDREHLLDCFFQTFTPMHQIALNMGFEIWKY